MKNSFKHYMIFYTLGWAMTLGILSLIDYLFFHIPWPIICGISMFTGVLFGVLLKISWLKRNWMYLVVAVGILASEYFAWWVYRDYVHCMPIIVIILFAAWIAMFAAFVIYIVFALFGLVESNDSPIDDGPFTPSC